jgi:hypothetical protein
MPSVASYAGSVCRHGVACGGKHEGGTWAAVPSSKAFPSSRIWGDCQQEHRDSNNCHYFSTALAGVDHIILVAVLVEQRLGVAARRVHGGRGRYVRARL